MEMQMSIELADDEKSGEGIFPESSPDTCSTATTATTTTATSDPSTPNRNPSSRKEAKPMSLASSPAFSLSSEDDEASSAASSAASASPPASAAAVIGPPAQRRRKKKKRLVESMSTNSFKDIYYLTGDVLGEGSYGRVETCINMYTDTEYAVKIISKNNWCFSRSKVLKEIELYYLCQGQREIIQLVEYFEEADYFYLIFEKAFGGQLLTQIQRRVKFTETEAATIVRDLAVALRFLHVRGIAHRDLKPENILCIDANAPNPIKLCDFDLCSSVTQKMTTPLLQSPVGSAEYMAPEVVNAFSVLDYDDDEDEDELTYDKRCDLWSLGIIAYILLSGYLPFAGHCDKPGCGWETGEECLQCQRSLFHAIKSGSLVFPEQHWASVSAEAKDLIAKLLTKEAAQRPDADSVLGHPWITQGGSPKTLETPAVLRRQVSHVKEISEIANSALAIKRNFEIGCNNGNSNNGNDSNGNETPATTRLMHKSATAADFSAPEALLGVPAASASPARKTSAQAQRKTSTGFRMMRRQTSLIFVGSNQGNPMFDREY